MTLTQQQAETFRRIEEKLQTRQPVHLTGKENGKTTLVHQALEVLGRKDEKSGRLVGTPRHGEQLTIEYFPRIYFPANGITVQHTMRQILKSAGLESGFTTADVVSNFDKLLSSAANNGTMICLAIDNTELLPKRAWTVLKALNEYRDVRARRTVGVGLLVASSLDHLKRIPSSFLARCSEFSIGKPMTEKDIMELIQILYPLDIRWIDDGALTTFKKCHTTLQMRQAIERCIDERKRYRLTSITSDLAEEKVGEVIGLSQAA